MSFAIEFKQGEFVKTFKAFLKDEKGQDLVEYALLLTFLALAAISILPILGASVNNIFSRSASSISGT